MKIFIINSIFAFAASLASASPVDRRQTVFAQATFSGAAGQSYTLSIPADGTFVPITNPLAVLSITLEGGPICSFQGVDGSSVTIQREGTATVTPPQAQVSAFCLDF